VTPDVFEALEQEYDAIEAMLGSLDETQWAAPSLCAGWTCADVVLHLAQTEESLLVSTGRMEPNPAMAIASRRAMGTIDDVVEEWVDAERSLSASERFERWKRGWRGCLAALTDAEPEAEFQWATNALKPRTLATTRLSEHWIHANDIAQPLGIDYPDTDRIWHIARLAHRTIPYAYRRSGLSEPPTVQVELAAPDGDRWVFGVGAPDVVISGTASEFCRIAARRLDPKDAGTIVSSGEKGAEVLSVVRTYA
jgi:uncharacterized protein (TIGR03084 family)